MYRPSNRGAALTVAELLGSPRQLLHLEIDVYPQCPVGTYQYHGGFDLFTQALAILYTSLDILWEKDTVAAALRVGGSPRSAVKSGGAIGSSSAAVSLSFE